MNTEEFKNKVRTDAKKDIIKALAATDPEEKRQHKEHAEKRITLFKRLRSVTGIERATREE